MEKTIGALVIDLEGAYSRMLWPSIAGTIQARGHDCLVLPANNPRHPYNYLYQYNHLFNFILPSNMDALILVPSTIMSFMESGESLNLIERIRKQVPIVSMNHRIEGVPSLVMNISAGIKAAIHHLVCDHRYSRIAFVEGPPENPENIERKEAFLKAMKEEGIDPGDDWLFTGDFTRTGAYKLGMKFGKHWVHDFDALLTANDYTAFGIGKSLNHQGFTIPKDLAIVGIDNVIDARFSRPPLTSVQQPFEVITARAANIAADICEGKDVPVFSSFDTMLVRRESCGCSFPEYDESNKYWRSGFLEKFRGADIDTIFPDLVTEPAVARILPAFREFAALIADSVPGNGPLDELISKLEGLIDGEMFQYSRFPDWDLIMLSFFSFCRQNCKGKMDKWVQYFFMEKCFVLISRKKEVWEGYLKRLRKENEETVLNELQRRMTRLLDLDALREMSEFIINEMKIRNCYIALLKDGRKRRGVYSTIPGYSKLVLAIKDGKRIDDLSAEDEQEFLSMKLWPGSVKTDSRGMVWIVTPLFNMDELYGFMVNEVHNYSGVITNALGHQVSLTLQRIYIDNERIRAEQKLQELLKRLEQKNLKLRKDLLLDELTGLWNRRGFLLETEAFLEANGSRHKRFFIHFADMDGLKIINDTYGHSEGDRAIIDTAEILKLIFREEDIIARIGGDEFLIFSGDVSDDFNRLIQCRTEAETAEYRKRNSQPYGLSFSMGFASGYTDDADLNFDEIMKEADDRLYVLKRKRKYGQK